MKKMTCRDMGGPCDAAMTANTPDEMMEKGMEHVRKAHPEMVDDIENMSDEDGKKWNDAFMKKWASTPNTK